jgi:NAD(P)-dependent dehydrogenase (short-subunit alcohol dehydrogenase family)
MSLPLRPRAVITGAAGGLGRALALDLAGRRGRVLIADLDSDGAQETARKVRFAGGEAIVVRCDVTQSVEVERLLPDAIDAFGGVDLLVNNAGVAVSGRADDVPLGDWEWVMAVNLWGVIHGCRAFVPHFRRQKSGHILNVASAAGLLNGPQMGPYNVSKAGVVALSETLAAELRGDGVGVTVLCPMFFLTNIHRSGRNHLEPGGEPAKAERAIERVEWLMGKTRVQAPEVARLAVDAVAANELYALPHVSGRWAWRVKRAVPRFFHRQLLGSWFRARALG